MSTDSQTATTNSATLYSGRVKWFNNKAGYGFVTIVSGPSDGIEKNTDIFAHHTTIKVGEEQYKYLVQGEYVQFSISTLDEGEHKYQAQEISGIGGGSLLCETRHDVRASAPRRTRPARGRRPRQQGVGPRDDEEWVLVKKSRNTSTQEETKE